MFCFLKSSSDLKNIRKKKMKQNQKQTKMITGKRKNRRRKNENENKLSNMGRPILQTPRGRVLTRTRNGRYIAPGRLTPSSIQSIGIRQCAGPGKLHGLRVKARVHVKIRAVRGLRIQFPGF